MKGNKGFTLIEIIVAVALVAILSAAIAPSVLNNIAQGRIARTQSDVQSIGGAIVRFKNDTGSYPRLVKAGWPDTVGNRFDALVSRSGTFAITSTTTNWPKFTSNLTSDVKTLGGSVEDFTSHLILGISRSATADSLYPRASRPDDPNAVGFRGGVISADQPDPWGHKYVCNVRMLGIPAMPVWVLSAGPDGVFETTCANDSGGFASDTTMGDDIGFRIQ